MDEKHVYPLKKLSSDTETKIRALQDEIKQLQIHEMVVPPQYRQNDWRLFCPNCGNHAVHLGHLPGYVDPGDPHYSHNTGQLICPDCGMAWEFGE